MCVPSMVISAPSRVPSNLHPVARFALDAGHFRVRHDGDAFVPAHFFQRLRNVLILAMREAAIAVEIVTSAPKRRNAWASSSPT